MSLFLRRFFELAFLIALLSACSSKTESFKQSFEHIKTDLFNYSYGRGGIYWVSENEVVLDAAIKNKIGNLERGIYLVNVNDGSSRLIAPINFKYGVKYCYDGKTLYLRNKAGTFDLTKEHMPFKLVIGKFGKKKSTNSYSAIRCEFVERPTNDGYYYLKEAHGALKVDHSGPRLPNRGTYRGELRKDNKTILVDSKLEVLRELDLTIGKISQPRYVASNNGYQIYKRQSNGNTCYDFWLYRTEGHTELQEEICLGNWALYASNILLYTNAGVFGENHNSRGSAFGVLVTNEGEIVVEKEGIRAAAISPEGCRVVYGAGQYRGRKAGEDYRQVLKLVDLCGLKKEHTNI